jgi:hypothetical protein
MVWNYPLLHHISAQNVSDFRSTLDFQIKDAEPTVTSWHKVSIISVRVIIAIIVIPLNIAGSPHNHH